MKEHPILFSAEMVRAILEGRKTQTRRVVKPQPIIRECCGAVVGPAKWLSKTGRVVYNCDYEPSPFSEACPYGQPGDRLWVRETWATVNAYDQVKPSDIPKGDAGRWPRVWHRATDAHEQEYRQKYFGKWRPSIFMPRWASRITLEVVSVRVERVQGISLEDIKAEGVFPGLRASIEDWSISSIRDDYYQFLVDFEWLWDSINAKRGFSWSSNPWVWAVTYKLLEVKQ